MADSDSEFASAESDQEEPAETLTTDSAKQPQAVEETEQTDSGGVEPQASTQQETSKSPSKDEQPVEEKNELVESKELNKDQVKEATGEDETPEKESTPAEPVAKQEPPSTEAKDTSKEGKEEEKREVAGAAEVKSEETKGAVESSGGGGGWGWGGWGSIWSSVSTVTESAQALSKKVSSVIASVEDTLGLPSPEELAQGEEKEGKVDEETKRLAEEMVEHDVPPEDMQEPVVEEPHHQSGSPIPEPHDDEQPGDKKTEPESDQTLAAVTGFFSGFATVGKGLMSGGLDALETLGKKTMEVLTEGDPGLRGKRSMLGGTGSSPTLSQLLQEAKAESEAASKIQEGDDSNQQPLTYSRLFDEYQGVAHLEALELLSKECEAKVRSGLADISGEELQSLKKKIEEVVEAFQVEEEPEVLDDDSSQLSEILEIFSDITLPLKVDKLIKVSNSWREKVAQSSGGDGGSPQNDEEGDGEAEMKGAGEGKDTKPVEFQAKEEDSEGSKRVKCEVLYEHGLRSLAELTSASIELFRKMAEVSLLPDAEKKSNSLEQAQKFNRLTVLVSTELDSLASVHAEAITNFDLKDTNSSVTSLYLESSNSGSYVQDAFQLLIPVLKFTLLQQNQSDEPPTNVMTRN